MRYTIGLNRIVAIIVVFIFIILFIMALGQVKKINKSRLITPPAELVHKLRSPIPNLATSTPLSPAEKARLLEEPQKWPPPGWHSSTSTPLSPADMIRLQNKPDLHKPSSIISK